MKDFNEMISNRSTLLVPIVSMRSYENNIYDMTCDGNVQRVISSILSIPDDIDYDITVIWPGEKSITKESYSLIETFEKYINTDKVHIELIDNYPVGGASVQRNIKGSQCFVQYILEWYHNIENYTDSHEKKPLIIYEADYFGVFVESYKISMNIETCFWCYASCTHYSRPDYIIPLEHIELELANSCDYLMLASLGQYYYFTEDHNIPSKKVSINTNFTALWHPMYQYVQNEEILKYTDEMIKEGYKIVFIPTRLTDKGYYADKVLSAIERIVDNKSYGTKILLLYSDPNESGYIEEYFENSEIENLVYKKISRDRNTFYTMIDQVDCVVPYLEDCTEKFHTSIQEFIYFRTKILYSRMWRDITSVSDGIDWSVFNEDLLVSRPTDIDLLKNKLLAAFSMKKKKLYTIEGFDRVGKDTILKYFQDNKEWPTTKYVYIQHNYEGKDPQPDYRNKDLFIPWLKRFQKAQDHELTKLYYKVDSDNIDNVYMTRKYISDYVYSHLFNREEITIKTIRSIKRYYDIVPVVILWKSYDEYLKRCKNCNSDVEYSEDEFNKIQQLFKEGANEYFGDVNFIEITEDLSTEDIIKLIF